MEHNLNNIVIDRVLRGIFSDKNDDIIFSLNQMQNLSLTASSEAQDIVDALGVSIMQLMRSKSIELSAENAIFDLSLLAAQYGTEQVKAAGGKPLTVPTMESFTPVEEGGKVIHRLKHTPTNVAGPSAIYALNRDSTLGAKYSKKTNDEDVNGFAYADGVITMPAGVVAGTDMFVMYEYASENAVEVVNAANKFSKMGKLTLEALVYDVCDPETKIFAYVILPRFQLSNDFDWSIGGDNQVHAFSGKANVDYCDKDKTMVKIVIVDDEEENA